MAHDSSAEDTSRTNRLIHEKSPYLLQHARNPVDWHPWGEEAFALARRENKPLFVSIGYSTCHWCHVMAHESFEDPDIARLMNEQFVNVKVDREERPDVDAVYMEACQLMTGRGGWPLTALLTPDRLPFFTGTYYPKERRGPMIGMRELVPLIGTMWRNRRDEVEETAREMASYLAVGQKASGDAPLGEEALHRAYAMLSERFDAQWGGFSHAPKFPTPHHIGFLLRYGARTGKSEAFAMARRTLDAMAAGGVYDHLGFGIHRYSTDREWLVPHFEKMLYDQALVAMAYIDGYRALGDESHRRVAEEILAYVLRDLASADGAFFCAEDADSEGEEGRFYVWSLQELTRLLGAEDAALFSRAYGVREGGNFADEASGRSTGLNILHRRGELEPGEEERLRLLRKKLFAARQKRVRPHLDDKILTDWNGLIIAALAMGGRVLGEPRYVEAAERAASLVLTRMEKDGRLLHRWRDGEAAIPAFLDDYAFLVWGLVELSEATGEERFLGEALRLSDEMIRLFASPVGGFFLTAADGEKLPARKVDIYDGALPSGNSVALMNLVRLSRMTCDERLLDRADAASRAFFSDVMAAPIAFTHLLCAVDESLRPVPATRA